jgi:Nicotinic acid mononucleotide adenylyltransferase
MVRAAIADHYKLEASDAEFHMPKPSFTIHTLAYLSEKHPDKKFVVIMGEDNLESLPKWKNHEQILDQYEVYVYPRPHVTNSELKRHPHVKMIDSPLLDISATYIRTCIKNNKSIRYLVPEPVEQLIRLKHFYQ